MASNDAEFDGVLVDLARRAGWVEEAPDPPGYRIRYEPAGNKVLATVLRDGEEVETLIGHDRSDATTQAEALIEMKRREDAEADPERVRGGEPVGPATRRDPASVARLRRV